MRTKTILTILIMTAVVTTLSLNNAGAGLPAPPGLPGLPGLPGPPNVNVRIDGYLPAPPGVHVQVDAGRPYYVERDRRVYIEKEKPAKRHKKQKKHHEDRGREQGHDK
ncbi:MAG: hypothetical protein Q7W05_13515 [Deltaproteobacteria bacterium]|nr:hypothetical protein [Deltaproteobacteria bacterium]